MEGIVLDPFHASPDHQYAVTKIRPLVNVLVDKAWYKTGGGGCYHFCFGGGGSLQPDNNNLCKNTNCNIPQSVCVKCTHQESIAEKFKICIEDYLTYI